MVNPPTATEQVVTGVVDSARYASMLKHVKENNIAYLLLILISYQFGVLDKVFTYGSTMCA